MNDAVHIVSLTLAFAQDVQRHASDIRVSETTRLPYPYPEDGAQRWIKTLTSNKANAHELNFAILANNKFVGTCGLAGIERSQRVAEYGYWIVYDHWGKGYATAAGNLIFNLAQLELGLGKLRSTTLIKNIASVRVLEKLGFKKVGERPSDAPKWPPTEILCDFEKTL